MPGTGPLGGTSNSVVDAIRNSNAAMARKTRETPRDPTHSPVVDIALGHPERHNRYQLLKWHDADPIMLVAEFSPSYHHHCLPL